MRKAYRFTLVVLAVVTIASLSRAQDVKTNFMPGTNFSKYTTYKWVSIQGGEHPNQIVDQEIKNAINSQLSAKGLTMTDSDTASLYIGYQIAVDQERQWNAWGAGGGLRWGGMGQATSSTISNGTLVLDFYDASNKQLVWQGAATKTIDPSSNPQKNQSNINKAMAKLLKSYPPKQK